MTQRARVGVDTGGTFTDVILWDAGQVFIRKILSTPQNPTHAIAEGLRSLDALGALLVHGTTVATNALLERRGARTGLVVNAGFEDILQLRRQARPELYALRFREPPHVVPRDLVFGISGRLDYSGQELQEITTPELDRLVEWAQAQRLESLAVCLLHAYANPEHERLVGERLRQAFPNLSVSLSHQVFNEFREYERCSTTAVNAFVKPVIKTYLTTLGELVERPEIMQSNGGLCSVELASELPVNTLLSGPAGGVIGALAVARELGYAKILTLDIGGTSTDVSMIDHEPSLRADLLIDGIAVHVPSLDIETVGAGGGSLAWLDHGGALRVGPQSAGSEPGPIAYGRGGTQISVTDANIYLRRIPEDSFNAGGLRLDSVAVEEAMCALAERVGQEPRELAEGVLRVANAAMVRALKVVSVARGVDPRECTLIAFGGGGGLHACALAEELGISRVVVPKYAGLLSAFGLLVADTIRVHSRSLLVDLDDDGMHRAASALAEFRELRPEDAIEAVTLRLRYEGQSFDLPVTWDPESRDTLEVWEKFESEHQLQFGYRSQNRVQLVSIMVTYIQPTSSLPFEDRPSPRPDLKGAIWRSNLTKIEGPMVVADDDCTTYVAAGWTARLQAGHMILEKG